MGILKFLKKGSAAEPVNGYQVKGTAYDNTAKALPPIRGTLPVQGNGPDTANELQRSAAVRTDELESSNANDSPVSSKRAGRLRSMSLGRPNTAPGGGAASGSDPDERPKSSSSRSPRDPSKAASSAAPKRKLGPPYLLGVVGPGDADGKGDRNALDGDRFSDAGSPLPPPVPSIADYFKQAPLSPSLASVHNTVRSDRATTASTGSTGGSGMSASGNMIKTARGHVDILDAQGAFKPSDFKTRVKAAGVRDYGEDVADRNLGVNGVDLSSPAVMAFYALTGGRALVYKSDGSAMDVHGNRYTPGNIPSHLQSPDDEEQDRNVARPNESTEASRLPARKTSLEPREEISRTSARAYSTKATEERARAFEGRSDTMAAQRRRMSAHGGIDTSSTPQLTARRSSMYPPASDFRSDEEAASAPDIPRIRPIPYGGLAEARAPRTQARARDSVLVTRKQQRNANSASESGNTRRTRPRTKSKYQETYSEQIETIGCQRRGSSAARRRKQGKSRANEYGSTPSSHLLYVDDDAIPPLPSSAIGHLSATTTTNSRPSSSSSRPRNRSIGGSSARGRTQLQDITEYVPERRSSLSVSSVPSSSLSSNPFPSSHSRHTADTSLDLSYSTPLQSDATPASERRGHSCGKVCTATITGSRQPGGYQYQRADPPVVFFSRGANGVATGGSDDDDDDVTTTTDGSDVDSFVEKRRRKRTDDEGLLFREAAYGAAGSGLPGLFSGEEYDNDGDSMIAKNHRESLTAPIWVSSLRYPSSNKDKSITCRSRAAASSTLSSHLPPPRIPSWDSSLPKHPKPSLSSHKYCYHPNDENDDSSSITISGSDTDCTSRAGSSVYDNEADTLSVADVYDALEKEVVGQLDIKLAMRLRREMERRERSTRSSAARRKPLGIQVK